MSEVVLLEAKACAARHVDLGFSPSSVGAVFESIEYRETVAGGQVRRVSEVRIAHGVHGRIQPASGRLLASTPVKSLPDLGWELAEDEREF